MLTPVATAATIKLCTAPTLSTSAVPTPLGAAMCDNSNTRHGSDGDGTCNNNDRDGSTASNDDGSSGDCKGSSSSSDDVSCTANTYRRHNTIAFTSHGINPVPPLRRHNAVVRWPLLTTLPLLPPRFLQVNEPSKAAPICCTIFTANSQVRSRFKA